MGRRFDEVDDIIIVNSGAAINNLSTLSASVWVFFDSGQGEGSEGRWFDKRGTGAASGWLFWMRSGSDASRKIGFRYDRATTQGEWNSNSGLAPTSGVWWNAAVTYDGTLTSNVPVIYLSGASVAINTIAAPVGALGNDQGSPIVLGNVNAGTRTWGGILAEMAVWNVILTASEITALALGVCPLDVRPASIIGYWPLWGDYSPEIDLSPTNITGSVSGAVADLHPPAVVDWGFHRRNQDRFQR